jgi:hypothetical protein
VDFEGRDVGVYKKLSMAFVGPRREWRGAGKDQTFVAPLSSLN